MTLNNHIYYDYCSFTEVNDKYMITCHKFCLSVFISDNYVPQLNVELGIEYCQASVHLHCKC